MTRLAVAAVIAALALPPFALGAISITAPTSVGTTVTLDGFDQQATFSATLTITGGGANGWNITAWAARPSSGSGTLSAVYVAHDPSVGACTGKSCIAPVATGLSWPVTLGTTSGGATKIFNAARGTGTGTDPVSVPFAADVAANTLTGAYTTTITVAISNGP